MCVQNVFKFEPEVVNMCTELSWRFLENKTSVRVIMYRFPFSYEGW